MPSTSRRGSELSLCVSMTMSRRVTERPAATGQPGREEVDSVKGEQCLPVHSSRQLGRAAGPRSCRQSACPSAVLCRRGPAALPEHVGVALAPFCLARARRRQLGGSLLLQRADDVPAPLPGRPPHHGLVHIVQHAPLAAVPKPQVAVDQGARLGVARVVAPRAVGHQLALGPVAGALIVVERHREVLQIQILQVAAGRREGGNTGSARCM